MKTMGKKALALLVVSIMLCTTLSACGSVLSIFGIGKYKVQGTYTAWLANTDTKLAVLTFSGDKVTYESMLLGTEQVGTYELENGVVTITYEDGDTSELDYDEDTDELSLGGVLVFKKDKQP